MPNQYETNIRSEEVQEILTAVPNWMIRWGNTLVLCIVLGLLVMSWLIKYPDTIPANILVTTDTPPEKIFAKREGQIQAVLVEDKELVAKNQLLAVIESTSDFEDVLLLKAVLDTLSVNYEDFYFPIEKLPFLSLGVIEPDYALFENSYTNYILNRELEPFSNESAANLFSITETRNRLNSLISQLSLQKKELELQKKDLERFKILNSKGAISNQEYDNKQLELLQAQRSFENTQSSVSQLRETMKTNKKDLRATEIKKTQDENSLVKNVIQSYNQLKNSLKKWELENVFESSIEGKVSFLSFWSVNQTVRKGDLVFTIIPNDKATYIGEIKAPSQNFGKIEVGQIVTVRLDNYPYTEFGILQGLVRGVSLMPDEKGSYLVQIEFPEKLVTTYGKEITFNQEMRGQAEIITEDLRLIERFFYQLRNIFQK